MWTCLIQAPYIPSTKSHVPVSLLRSYIILNTLHKGDNKDDEDNDNDNDDDDDNNTSIYKL